MTVGTMQAAKGESTQYSYPAYLFISYKEILWFQRPITFFLLTSAQQNVLYMKKAWLYIAPLTPLLIEWCNSILVVPDVNSIFTNSYLSFVVMVIDKDSYRFFSNN